MGACHRWPCRPTFACFVASILMATSLALSAPAHSKSTPVALGRVTSKVQRPQVDLPSALRAEVLRQLQSIDLDEVPEAERVVLSASLTQLETRRQGNRAHSSAVVSATLTKQKGGALVAVLRGKARAEDDAKEAVSNELAVMRAAARSALRGIPKALE